MIVLNRPVTVDIPFTVTGEKARLVWWTAWFSKFCAHRLLNDAKENEILVDLSQTSFLKYARKRCYDVLPNRRYVDGIAVLIHSTLKSARKLGLKVNEIKLRQWLLFQCEADKKKKGNLNVRLTSTREAEALVFNQEREPRKIKINLRTPKKYEKLLKILVERAIKSEVGYPARIVIKEYNTHLNDLRLYCSLQVIVPYDLYLEVMRKYDAPLGNHVAGIDVNVDRLNIAIVDRYGRLRDVKTFWFREITSRGYRRKRAWTKIYQAIHDMLNYAYHHGVSHVVLENPEIVGYLKYYWIKNGNKKTKNYNYRISIFRNRIIETIAYKTPLYGLKTIYVNPKGTTRSKEHEKIMKKYGLDRHTASAYLIALRSLKKIHYATK